jgi:hypothetical protein
MNWATYMGETMNTHKSLLWKPQTFNFGERSVQGWLISKQITYKQYRKIWTELKCLRILKSTIFWDISPLVRWQSKDVWRNISPPYSGSKNKPNKTSALLSTCFHAGILLSLDPENGDMFLRNVMLNLNGLQSFIYQKTILFVTTAMRTSDSQNIVQLWTFLNTVWIFEFHKSGKCL